MCRDTDTGPHGYVNSVEHERHSEGLNDGVGNKTCINPVLYAWENNAELITPEARKCVGASQPVLQPHRDLSKEMVSDFMTKAVIHQLESIEIDIQESKYPVLPRRESEFLSEPLGEKSSVRQTSQRVCSRLLEQKLAPTFQFAEHPIETRSEFCYLRCSTDFHLHVEGVICCNVLHCS